VARTPRWGRARQHRKSDTLDPERIAREVLAVPALPKAREGAGQDPGPDERHRLLALWHDCRRSILASRQQVAAGSAGNDGGSGHRLTWLDENTELPGASPRRWNEVWR
jgi:hypothetical protein